jgi:Glycosyl transferase family 2
MLKGAAMESTTQLLNFINGLIPEVQIDKILSSDIHLPTRMKNWVGLSSLVCASSKGIYDIDIRWTTSDQIFRQQLFDYGWTEEQLLGNHQKSPDRHKLIIYLCDLTVEIPPAHIHAVPTIYLVGKAWQSITHIYTRATACFPVTAEMITGVNLQDNYATTTNLTKIVPQIIRPFPSMVLASNETHGGLRTQGLFKNTDSPMPLISIVTVVYNGEKYLEQTIQSVINQSYENLEYIIIDGCSTDRTLEIIAKYNDYINYWVSAPDDGIYSAMNKGIKLAIGSHVLHLNADDLFFEPDGLEFLAKANFDDNHMRSMLKVDLATGKVVKDPVKLRGNSLAENVDYDSSFFHVSHTAMLHPCFVGKINDASIFTEEYRICSDTVMLIHKLQNESVRLSARVLSIFRTGGASSNNKVILLEMWEEIKKQPGLWPKISTWLELQGVFAHWK